MKTMGRKAVAVLVLLAFGFTYGCTTQMAQVKRKPIYDNAKDLMALPPKQAKKQHPKGTIVPIEKGQQAPFPGVLLTEKRAKALAQLRINYDHLYSIAETNRRFTVIVLKTADRQLAAADQANKRLYDQQNSWWSRNKVWVAVATTFVLTLGLGGVVIWGASELRK
jgi:hypothetical protein